MKATQLLHNLGQSLWLDNITRDLLNSGTLKRYVDELSVTGLTSNPTISERCPRQREITDIMSADGGDYDTVLDQFATAGIDICDLAAKLQDEGANRSSIPGTS
jgi:transaldolase